MAIRRPNPSLHPRQRQPKRKPRRSRDGAEDEVMKRADTYMSYIFRQRFPTIDQSDNRS